MPDFRVKIADDWRLSSVVWIEQQLLIIVGAYFRTFHTKWQDVPEVVMRLSAKSARVDEPYNRGLEALPGIEVVTH